MFLLSSRIFSQQELFEKNMFSDKNIQLQYRFSSPDTMISDQKYPLILYLHGAGERGDDNEITLKNGILNFVTPENKVNYPCYILVPQCPKEYRWVEVHWSLPAHKTPDEISLPLGAVMKLIEDIIQQHSIDTNRIYVTGLSMGGFGTWDLISRYPGKFAAAVPVCGGGDTAFAKVLAQVPIWAFHGMNDQVVIPQRSIDMVDAINKSGGNARLTIYKNVAHNAWIRAYADQYMIQWLFSQTKQRRFDE